MRVDRDSLGTTVRLRVHEDWDLVIGVRDVNGMGYTGWWIEHLTHSPTNCECDYPSYIGDICMLFERFNKL